LVTIVGERNHRQALVGLFNDLGYDLLEHLLLPRPPVQHHAVLGVEHAIGRRALQQHVEIKRHPPSMSGRPIGSPAKEMAVAGELGLEPRLTVPKTVVLPLHHAPAGPAQPRPAAGRRSDTTRPRATQAGFFALAKVVSTAPADAAKTFFDEAFSALAGPRRRRYKPAPQVGVWLSLVEHCVRDAGVAGSNPATPTIFLRDLSRPDQAPLGAPV